MSFKSDTVKEMPQRTEYWPGQGQHGAGGTQCHARERSGPWLGASDQWWVYVRRLRFIVVTELALWVVFSGRDVMY